MRFKGGSLLRPLLELRLPPLRDLVGAVLEDVRNGCEDVIRGLALPVEGVHQLRCHCRELLGSMWDRDEDVELIVRPVALHCSLAHDVLNERALWCVQACLSLPHDRCADLELQVANGPAAGVEPDQARGRRVECSISGPCLDSNPRAAP